MCAVTHTLMNKQALPDKLKQTFFECIRRRTRHTGFNHEGEVKLTHNQWKHARKTGKDQVPGCDSGSPKSALFHPEDESGELLDAFQRYFIHLSATDQPDFIHLSSILGAKPAELLAFWWRNIMKSNEINHEPDMISASPAMRLARSPDSHDSRMSCHEPAAPSGHAMTTHEPAAAGFPQARTIIEDYCGEEGMAREMAERVAALPRKTRRPEIAISYFHNDPAKAPSAVFEFGDRKFSLLFATADHAEEKLYRVSDAEWLTWLNVNGGSEVRTLSRAATQAGKLSRYVMSPLYAATDKYGYKAPVVGNCAVVLCWDDEGPAVAILVENRNTYSIKLERFSNGEGRKPLFKGRAALPMQDDDPAAMAA